VVVAVDPDQLLEDLHELTQKWRRDAGACAEHAAHISRINGRYADTTYFQGEAKGLRQAIRDLEKVLEEES
jgi:hypothetical protein